jgi:outer membrane protein TolC
MKTKSILTLITVLSGYVTNGQHLTSLNEIIQTIDTANPTAKMYEAGIQSLDAAAKGARSWMPAEFGTGLWMVPYNPGLWQKGANGATGMGQYMLSVQQMIPNKKKQAAEAAYMEAMSAPEKERKMFALNEVHAEAKKNYYDWIIINKRLAILDENEQLLLFMIKNAEIRYKNGLDKLNAYYKAKAELGNLLNTKTGLENEINQKRIRLNTLMNRDKLQSYNIDSAYTTKNYDSSTFNANALNTKSNIRAIDKDIQLSALQQDAERAKALPEYGLRYDHMFGFGGLPMQYTLMGIVRIPIGRANMASKANVESLRWKSESLSQQKQLLLNETSGLVSGMTSDIISKKKQVKLFEDNILPAMRKNYEVTQLGYQQNTEQLLTLLDAWDGLYKTQTEYLNQLQQLLNMQVELERILEIK